MTITLCLLCFYGLIPIQAQTITAPGPDLVASFYDEITVCKQSQKEAETTLKVMQELSGLYTQDQFDAAKSNIALFKACVGLCSNELDKLKKDYPEWFRLSGATIDLGRHGNTTPMELEKQTQNLIIALARIRSAFAQFRNPE